MFSDLQAFLPEKNNVAVFLNVRPRYYVDYVRFRGTEKTLTSKIYIEFAGKLIHIEWIVMLIIHSLKNR